MKSLPRSRRAVIFFLGALAMLAALLTTVVLRALTGEATAAEVVGDRVVVLIPGNLFEFGIQTFGPLAKKLLFVGLSLAQILVGGGLALVVDRVERFTPRSESRLPVWFADSAVAVLVVVGGVLLAVNRASVLALAPSLVLLALVYAVVLVAGRELLSRASIQPGPGTVRKIWFVGSPTLSRRSALVVAAGAIAAVGGAALARSEDQPVGLAAVGNDQRASATTSAPPTVPENSVGPTPAADAPTAAASVSGASARTTDSTPIPTTSAPAVGSDVGASPTSVAQNVATPRLPPGTVSEVTPTDQFYKVSKNFFADPQVDGARWRLTVDGLVDQRLSLALLDLKTLPSVEKQHTLTCISNEVGGNLISNATWKGIRLADLLRKAGPRPGVQKVVLRGADGYADSITLEKAMDPSTLLVFEMNGEALPSGHGFPVRALIPDIYGMKNVKWLTGIELVNSDFQGYWQRGGWSDSAIIKTMSRIDVAKGDATGQSVTVAGVAFAGARGISTVEVSDDGGRTWKPATVEAPDRSNVWTLWVSEWKPSQKGNVKLLVRAVDGTGKVQSDVSTPPFPDGASGYHSVVVRVG